MNNIQKYELQVVPFESLLCPPQLYEIKVSVDIRISK